MARLNKPKLSTLVDSEWISNRYERVFWPERTTTGQRVVAAVSEDQTEVALRLMTAIDAPFLLLWVLHTPRGGSRPGRYQSPPLNADELEDVLRRYADLFEQDGRSDLWIHSRTPAVTIALDRHDLLYAYGPQDAFIDMLHAMHFSEGHASIPSPHAHEYHPDFDELERALARELEWTISELRPEDEQ